MNNLIYYSEKILFFLFLVMFLYIIYTEPINIIPLIIYFALIYIPINIFMIINKETTDVEMAHRLLFIVIGIIPILSLFSEPAKSLITIKS
jgi:hypothetical protein